MYGITSIICDIKSNGITVQNQDAINETIGVIKIIFTPINALIILAPLGNLFGKVYDKVIDTSKASRRLIIMLVIYIVVLIFEANYIESFILNLLRINLLIV